MRELHSHLGRHFYDQHHHCPRHCTRHRPITFPITAPAAAAARRRENTFFLSADRKNVLSLHRVAAAAGAAMGTVPGTVMGMVLVIKMPA